jgi:L-fucose isomerase-like protein
MGEKVDVIASSDYAELNPYVHAFGTIHYLRHSKVLLIASEAMRPRAKSGDPADYAKQFGTAFPEFSYSDLKAFFEAADQNEARRLADDLIKRAVRVVEPSKEQIVDSMRLYLGMRDLMRREKANGIAIECLGGFNRRQLPAYPCLGFSAMNGVGQYGVCECDVESAMTMLLVTSFSGKPGFISDPAFDTSRNEVIHAHCVCSTVMQGFDHAGSPYVLRSHLEDHKGASMQVLFDWEGPVTVARFMHPTRFVVSTAEATGNVDDDRGCRTKMCTRVADARKFLRNYAMVKLTGAEPLTRGGTGVLHRVVFYGDHVEMIERLGRLTGFQVIREI